MSAETPKRPSPRPGQESVVEPVAEPIVIECELPAPPEKVWRALTEPALLARWLLPTRAAPADGALAFDGEAEGLARRIDCRVLDAEPNRRLSYRWREPAGESVVTFELSDSAGGGTWLKVVHGGFAAAVLCARVSPPSLQGRGKKAANDDALILRCAA
jgi:uncharacterized protein YndB with AHSA1/START domain